jgi:alpha-tubulin suppressor-like RCC1 family protein
VATVFLLLALLVIKYEWRPAGVWVGKPLPSGKVRPQIINVEGIGAAWLLAPDGSLWHWGFSPNISASSMTNHLSPATTVPDRVGSDRGWLKVAHENCSALGLKNDGTLWQWGFNQQSGTDFKITSTPIRIGADADWASVAVGMTHFLALKNDGSLWAWGQNDKSQLGDGTTGSKLNPTRIGTDNDWRSIAAGSCRASFALKTNGTLWAWGEISGKCEPVPSQISLDTNWLAIAAGFDELFALKPDGTLWRRVIPSYTPSAAVAVTGSYKLDLHRSETGLVPGRLTQAGTDNDWTEIYATGLRYFARKRDGSWWVWGFVDGTNTVSPQRVPFDFEPWAYSPGARTTLVLMRDGGLWSSGQRIGAKRTLFQSVAARFIPGMANANTTQDKLPVRIWELPAGIGQSP